MEYSFPRYLLSKRSVDDRALNRQVWQALAERLTALEGRPTLSVLELGGGVGTMFERMVEWGLITRAEYTLLDSQPENIAYARRRLADWAEYQRLEVQAGSKSLLLKGAENAFYLDLREADVLDFARRERGRRRWDLIVAHAFLDLMDAPALLPALVDLTRPGGLLYFTLNFDGMTAFEPVSDANREDKIIGLYHRSMDRRMIGGKLSGDSRTGRHLFHWLDQAGLRVQAAGSSDWVVYPQAGRYPADEAYFLRFILHFFEESLSREPDLDPAELSEWLAHRRRQIDAGELVFIAHQIDFLVEAG